MIGDKIKDCWLTQVKRMRMLVQPDGNQKIFIDQLKKSFNRALTTDKLSANYYIPLFISRRVILSFIAFYGQDYPTL